MKNENRLAQKYLQAFINALPANQVVAELQTFVALMGFILNNDTYKEYFFSPLVKNIEKKELLKQVLAAGDFSKQTKNFVLLLLEKNRLNLSKYLVAAASLAINLLLKQIEIKVTLADEKISPEIQEKLEKVIKAKFNGQKPLITYVHQPNLLGGFVVEANQMYIDASVRNDLNQLKLAIAKQEMPA